MIVFNGVKNKWRFSTSVGLITMEDVFDLPLTAKGDRPSLDGIARGLSKQIRDIQDNESFIPGTISDAGTARVAELEQRLDFIKMVIADKVETRDKKEAEAAKRSRDAKIDELIQKKKDAALEDMDIADLEKLKES